MAKQVPPTTAKKAEALLAAYDGDAFAGLLQLDTETDSAQGAGRVPFVYMSLSFRKRGAGIQLVRINYKTGRPAVPGDKVVITEAIKPDFDFAHGGQRIIEGRSDDEKEDGLNDYKQFGNSVESESFQLGTQY